MYSVEKVIRNIKGQDVEVRFFAGDGRLSTDPPEIKIIKGYKILSSYNFSLAIYWNSNQGKKTVYFPLIVWDKNAELMSRLAFKWQRIIIHGRLETKKYINKKGEKVSKDYIIVEKFNCIDYKQTINDNQDNQKCKIESDSLHNFEPDILDEYDDMDLDADYLLSQINDLPY